MPSNSIDSKKKREVFSEIYAEYFPRVFNAIYPKVGNRDDANDICQEVFIILYNKFEEVQDVRKWLFGTLRNKVMQYYERKPPTGIDIDKVFEDVTLTFVNGFRDARIIINEAIENVKLSDEERLVLDYIAFNNYSYSNVGEIIGLTKRQVQYKYLNIVKEITNYLREKGIKNIEDLL